MSSRISKYLIACCFILFVVISAKYGLAADNCDNKCRQRTTFVVEGAGGGTSCIDYEVVDCAYCVAAKGRCKISEADSFPNALCVEHDTQLRRKRTLKCPLVCDLTAGGGGSAQSL
jgi:hypothetical protein